VRSSSGHSLAGNASSVYNAGNLDDDVLRFTFYRRNLQDLTDWLFRILYENTEEELDRHDLEGIVEDCISGWPRLEDGMPDSS
jgi:hypothetical protein